ncbi:MAG: LacI family DNA-binding transcriptional regulator [Streptosporangiales bacterium]|nr:LacI family DNA-binding transcriptional regulator [Streptosporangiales bacterium]
MRVTIRQVAAAAGVSTATVSRVLAGTQAVSPELAERVRQTAASLGYRPNVLAQGLARGRSGVVGVLVPNLANPYFNDTIKALMHSAERDGYRVIVADSDERRENELPLGESLLRWSDGLVLVASRAAPTALRRLVGAHKPVVAVNHKPKPEIDEFVHISVNAYTPMRELCRHLVREGHRRIVYLSGPRTSWQSQERWRAVRSARRWGASVSSVPCGGTIEEGYAAAEGALGEEPSAVMAFNDLAAFGFLSRCGELGLRVPEDLSLTGFDDIPFAQFTSPPLTTVRSPLADVGVAAWQAMRRLLDGERRVLGMMLPSEMVIRSSTAPPRSMLGGSEPDKTTPTT